MEQVINETKLNLLNELNIADENSSNILDEIASADHRYLKDLKVNVSNMLNAKNISRKESLLIALAVAVNEKNQKLIKGFSALAEKEGAVKSEIAEIYGCVSLLNVNNVFYRFRHFTKKEYYENTPAGIKMSIMMSPVTGKEFFELVSLAVSALNGCEMCVNAHEQALIKQGSSEARVYDTVRLAAVVRGLAVVI